MPVGGAGGGGEGGTTGSGGIGGAAGGSSAPARYPADRLISPINPFVVDTLRAVRELDASADDQIFMKVGASGTVSTNLLYCLAGPSQPQFAIDLGGRDELLPTLDHFRQGDAAGSTPFDRPTLAAVVGKTASWAISGSPSPLDQEIAAIAPRFALINYGTNDMNMGVTHRSALWPFYDNFTALLDQLLGQGIIPIVSGLNPRADSAAAADWVPTYDAVTRAICEARQIPYINLFRASVDLPAMGLLGDGIHGNVYHDANGDAQPCFFVAEGLDYNYDVRNLLTLQALDLVRRVTLDGEAAPDTETPQIQGSGSADDPFVIDSLPFSHSADTSVSESATIDGYPDCDGGQDESGPELFYRLDLAQGTPFRVLLLDEAGVDVDLHLLGQDPVAQGCLERDDRIIERTLEPGSYHLAVDSYVSGGAALAGRYLLIAIACEPGDPDCS